MPRRGKLQNSWTKGVLDRRLRDRIDIAHYYNSCRTGDNIEIRPQGGFRRRAGTLHLADPIRKRLEPVAIDSDMITLHNDGVPANLVDQDLATLFTTVAVTTPEFIVVEFDLGDDVPIVFVDVEAFKAGTTGADDALEVAYWSGGEWVSIAGADDATLSPRRNVRTTERTRRFGARPGQPAATARHWRVMLHDAAGIGTFTIGRMRFWTETAFHTDAELDEFAKSATETYQVVLTARNIDIFDAGRYLASLPVDVAHFQVDEVKYEQDLDTGLLFHKDVATIQLTRQGASDEWNADDAMFTNVPTLSSSTSFSGNQDEIQDVAFSALDAGEQVVLYLGKEISAPLVYATTGDLPDQIKAVLEALPSVPSGAVTVNVRSLDPLTVRVKFGGAGASRRWPVIDAQVLGRSELPVTTIVQQGLKADGTLMSDETGWPRAGAIVAQRLVVGGFRAAPGTFHTSRAGFGDGAFDMRHEVENPGDPLTADFGIGYTMDSDEVETIVDIFLGRHLQIFTESGEWWIENRTLDATQPLNVILSTRHGVDAKAPIVFADNATLFLQAREDEDETGGVVDDTGQVLRDMVYTDVEQNYSADPLSLLGPHLLGDVVDLAHRRARSVNRGNRISLINADGTMAVLTLLRSQEVIALTGPMTTNGLWRRVMVDTNGRAWMLVERFGTWRMEQRRDDILFDAAVIYKGDPATVISGLPYPDGTEVWALADRDLVGPFTAAGGAITLATAASDVIAGLPFYADTETNPVRERINEAQPFRPPGRIYEIELSLIDTGQVEIGVNGEPPVEVDLHVWDGELPAVKQSGEEADTEHRDLALLDRLITGYRLLEDVQGFSEHPRIRITQSMPAPLEVRSLRYEISYAGR